MGWNKHNLDYRMRLQAIIHSNGDHREHSRDSLPDGSHSIAPSVLIKMMNSLCEVDILVYARCKSV